MKSPKAICFVLCLSAASVAVAQEVPVTVAPALVTIVAQDQAQPAISPRAQTPPPPGQPGQTAPAPVPPRQANPLPPMRLQGQPINVRIELTITDQTGSAPAVKKTVLMTVADEERGAIRSNAQIARATTVKPVAEGGAYRMENVPLSIDATPTVLGDSRIRLRLNLEYDVVGGTSSNAATPGTAPGSLDNSQVRQSLGVVLTSGVPLVVAQSADPHSDRRVSLEVKATVLK